MVIGFVCQNVNAGKVRCVVTKVLCYPEKTDMVHAAREPRPDGRLILPNSRADYPLLPDGFASRKWQV